MEICRTVAAVRGHVARRRASGRTTAFVPTMGALHDGHGACVAVARDVPDGAVVVSIFVNPTQFAPGEDLSRYPRPLESDLEACRRWGVDAVFVPSPEEMYAEAQQAWVEVEGVTGPLCGRSRPGHFRGVATVVTKLFNIVQPDVAVFGQKDAQQALVIHRMVQQLALPVELRLAPIAREADGLALSSRNAYLSAAERERATALYAGLRAGRDAARDGERDPARVLEAVRGVFAARGVNDVEYAEILSLDDLSPLDHLTGRVILAVAARIGATRLIDNVVLRVSAGGCEELPTMW